EPDPGEKKDPGKPPKPTELAAVSQKNITPEAAAGKTSYRSPRSAKSPNATGSQSKRRSWRRSSLKGTKRRKSLPPFHQDVTGQCCSALLQRLLRSVEWVGRVLEGHRNIERVGLEWSLTVIEPWDHRMGWVGRVLEGHRAIGFYSGLVGSLKDHFHLCFRVPSDSISDESVGKAKEYITRFSDECQAWDELLQRYHKDAEEMSRQLEECKSKQGRAEPPNYLQTSQAEVLSTKPNYQRILDEQGEVLSSMELVLDELQQAAKLLRAFSEDSGQYLRGLSEQLASQTFRQLENSPVRKLIAAPERKAPPEG
ncbi:DSN1 protein, partial [Odontophorus gujanensis]|nr:DSN1 protein [Odontophorus gujanensis]